MAGKRVRGVVCALLVLMGTIASASRGEEARSPVPAAGQAAGGPQITAQIDRAHARMTATYKGLVVRKTSTRADRSFTVDIQYGRDAVFLAVDKDARTTVARGGSSVQIDSPEALARVQEVLAGSSAIFAVRALLAERESVSNLEAPEFTLLAVAAFVASLTGDTDAPTRLADRFVEKHRGIVRRVSAGGGCWDTYAAETTSAWNDLQACMNEANQDSSLINGAYRRLACNAVWLLRSESAWFEYIECINPLVIGG